MIHTLHERAPGRGPAQLELFDYRPPVDAYCFAMRSMHGHTFVEAMHRLKPVLVVDARSHPSFNLTALNRQHAMEVIRRTAGKRVLASVQLRFSNRHEDRWRAMSEVRRLLLETANLFKLEVEADRSSLSRCIVFFVSNEDDIGLLTSGMSSADPDASIVWRPGRVCATDGG